MFGGIRLGRIAGLEVILDWSLLIIFAWPGALPSMSS